MLEENSTPASESETTGKGFLRGKPNLSRAKIQTCSFSLGQYAKFQSKPRPPFNLVSYALGFDLKTLIKIAVYNQNVTRFASTKVQIMSPSNISIKKPRALAFSESG